MIKIKSITYDDLTKQQKETILLGEEWFKNDNEQLFVIAGYAGTGKSTIINILTQKLGLTNNKIAFATYTGKASLVLIMNNNPATTLHRLLYDTVEIWDENQQKYIYKFYKKPFIDPNLRLIVVDEYSMVPEDIAKDLIDFGIKIIALGDPAQLPPINSYHNLFGEPHIFLSEVHRQAQNNPIIRLSMSIRKNNFWDIGEYADEFGNVKVKIIKKSHIIPGMLLEADQVLVGKNKTRKDFNSYIRKLKGFESQLPVRNDKLVCLRNNYQEVICGKINETNIEIPLVNGLVGYCMQNVNALDIDTNKRIFYLNFRPEFFPNSMFRNLPVDLELFEHFPNSLPSWKRNSLKINEFDFGDAITVHKAQGSSWDKVFVYDEMLSRDMYQKWLYTAVTRANDKFILAI